MAQQHWNLSPVVPGTFDPFADSSAAEAPEPGAVPGDVLLLGPRDERDEAMAPPRMESQPERPEKPELRPSRASYMPPPRKNPPSRRTVISLAALVVVCVGVPSVAYLRSSTEAAPVTVAAPAPAPTVVQGSATIISRPDGAQVFVNGQLKGLTPLTVTMPVGSHTLELQNGAYKRSLPLVIETGAVVRQYIDLAPSMTHTGRLEVMSEPAGAQVSIDGVPQGATPLAIESIEPGVHRVTIAGADATVNRSVNVAAGATASVVATLAASSGAAGGWISIVAPVELQVLENGRVIGSSTTERLMLPAGKHELEFVSAAFEFNTSAAVTVPAGKTVRVPVAMPKSVLSINALPWAEVWLDGQAIGTTPLGNISVDVGDHEVVWRHPQLGERRQVIKVTGRAPVRAGVDFTK